MKRSYLFALAVFLMSAPALAQKPASEAGEAGETGELPAPDELSAPGETGETTETEQPREPATLSVEGSPADAETSDVSGDRAIREEMDQDAGGHPAKTNSFVLAPHIGVLVPQLFSDLGSWPIFGLEAGYVIPSDLIGFTRPLQISLDVMYTQPGAEGSSTDLNLGTDGGTDYDWDLEQRTLVLELTGLFRFMPPGETISAYGLIGPRLYLMESVLTASSDGANFGENRETKTQVGMVVGGGAEFALGPGSLYGTLEFGWSDLDERITGDSNTGAFVLDVGYRFFLF